MYDRVTKFSTGSLPAQLQKSSVQATTWTYRHKHLGKGIGQRKEWSMIKDTCLLGSSFSNISSNISCCLCNASSLSLAVPDTYRSPCPRDRLLLPQSWLSCWGSKKRESQDQYQKSVYCIRIEPIRCYFYSYDVKSEKALDVSPSNCKGLKTCNMRLRSFSRTLPSWNAKLSD